MTPVRREISIAATPEVVFEMFTDPALLARWLGSTAILDAQPGGRFSFEVAPGERCTGEYVHLDPPRSLSFTWGWESGRIPVAPGSSLVEVRLHPTDGGTTVVLTHGGLADGDIAALHDEGWRQFLARLAAACEGRSRGPDPATTRTPEEALADLRSRRQEER